jgi:hypothetical protein
VVGNDIAEVARGLLVEVSGVVLSARKSRCSEHCHPGDTPPSL